MKPAVSMIAIVSSLLLCVGCASLADIKSLEKRISTVEAENKNLRSQVQDLSGEMDRQKELYAGQDAELYQFKEEMQKLNGKLDETIYKFNQEKLDREKSMQSFRDTFGQTPASPDGMTSPPDQRMETAARPGSDAMPPPSASAAPIPPSGAEDMTEENLYRLAKDAYDQKKYDAARQYFEQFLEKYPKSNIADNARFWIGEAYFSEGWYQKAILEYQDVIEKYPKGNKVPAAYLKQGLSFFKLGENANAKLVLNELIKRFPESSEADAARQQVKQIP
jgi:tol-pal system protein YbgF